MFVCKPHILSIIQPHSALPAQLSLLLFARQIGIGAAVTPRPLPHHRAYGSVHGGSSWLR